MVNTNLKLAPEPTFFTFPGGPVNWGKWRSRPQAFVWKSSHHHFPSTVVLCCADSKTGWWKLRAAILDKGAQALRGLSPIKATAAHLAPSLRRQEGACSATSHLGVSVSCEWVKCEWKSLSRVQLFATLWTVAHQAPLLPGFSRQEYWHGLPFPSCLLWDWPPIPLKLEIVTEGRGEGCRESPIPEPALLQKSFLCPLADIHVYFWGGFSKLSLINPPKMGTPGLLHIVLSTTSLLNSVFGPLKSHPHYPSSRDLLFGDTLGSGSVFLQRRPWPQGFPGAFGGLHRQNSTWGLKGLEMPSDQNGQLLQLTWLESPLGIVLRSGEGSFHVLSSHSGPVLCLLQTHVIGPSV